MKESLLLGPRMTPALTQQPCVALQAVGVPFPICPLFRLQKIDWNTGKPLGCEVPSSGPVFPAAVLDSMGACAVPAHILHVYECGPHALAPC